MVDAVNLTRIGILLEALAAVLMLPELIGLDRIEKGQDRIATLISRSLTNIERWYHPKVTVAIRSLVLFSPIILFLLSVLTLVNLILAIGQIVVPIGLLVYLWRFSECFGLAYILLSIVSWLILQYGRLPEGKLPSWFEQNLRVDSAIVHDFALSTLYTLAAPIIFPWRAITHSIPSAIDSLFSLVILAFAVPSYIASRILINLLEPHEALRTLMLYVGFVIFVVSLVLQFLAA